MITETEKLSVRGLVAAVGPQKAERELIQRSKAMGFKVSDEVLAYLRLIVSKNTSGHFVRTK